jgi:hypothetical protein
VGGNRPVCRNGGGPDGPCGSGSSVRTPAGISLQNVHKRNLADENTGPIGGVHRLKRPNPPLERVLWCLERAIRRPQSVASHFSFLDFPSPSCLLALCLRPWRSVPRFRRWRPRFSIPVAGIAFLRPSPVRRPAGAWGDRRRRPRVGLQSGPWKPFRRRGPRGRRTRARPDESGSPVPKGPPRPSSIQNRRHGGSSAPAANRTPTPRRSHLDVHALTRASSGAGGSHTPSPSGQRRNGEGA